MKRRWYIKRNNGTWYAGADQWTNDFSARYLWYTHAPYNHPVFYIYPNECEIVEESYYAR